MKKKMIKAGAIAGIVGMLIGSAAYAGTAKEQYSTVVGRFNGSGYSRYQTKTTTGKNGYIYSNTVGGKYKVDVRMQTSSASGDWLRNVSDGTKDTVKAHSKHTKGSQIQLKFSNDITTPVTVAVDGDWKSN
ncbi:MAG: hypothetical protein K2K70_12630 [Lachnospiraceae bacterium]|nr:hypothetical protein [Lachnospiraceae bacterium]